MPDHGGDTRTRIVDAALRLFAERGFKATTIADLEAAAGLVPRSGTFYHHFASKRDVLDACVGNVVQRLSDEAQKSFSLLPLGDLRAELALISRTVLRLLELNRPLVQLLEREGDQLPELRTQVANLVGGAAYSYGVELVRARLGDRADAGDLVAVIAVLAGSLTNYRRNEWTMGKRPLEVDEDRYLAAWLDVAMHYVEGLERSDPT